MSAPYRIPGLIRRARRIAALSQHQMARRAEVSPSTVGRVEAGVLTPSLGLLQRLLGSAGLYLAAVDADGHVILPMEDRGDIRGAAKSGRHEARRRSQWEVRMAGNRELPSPPGRHRTWPRPDWDLLNDSGG
jgi:transcriptional regulator with XRE-family HTH domain